MKQINRKISEYLIELTFTSNCVSSVKSKDL